MPYVAQKVVGASTSETQVVPASASRTLLVLQNLDTTDPITVGGDGVTAGVGTVLNPAGAAGEAGGSLTLTWDGYDSSCKSTWNCIAGAAANLAVTEGFND